MTEQIQVVKRDGAKELLDYEKINKVLLWSTENISGVSASDVAMNAHLQLYNGITTEQIHRVLIQSAASLISEKNPNYQQVASNLLNYLIRKQIFHVQDNLPDLKKVIEKNIKSGVYDDSILEHYNDEELDKLNRYIRHNRDYNFSYAGLQQLLDKYLLKDRNSGEVYETPQFMYMLIAMTIFSQYSEGSERLSRIKSFYDDISLFKINLPTPIMCGVRTPIRQYSSCTLIDVGDSMESIIASTSAVLRYTAKRAGIGLNMGRIRAIGDKIRGGEVVHTGVIPFLKLNESATKSCTQNGVRGGGSTVYFPFWHKEIMDIMVLKNNKGTDDNRVRKMDYGIQLCRLFYQRLVEDGEISLFSPADVIDLYDNFGDNDKFEELYLKYERATSIDKKKVKARALFNLLCQERIGTGRIYVQNIDHANEHSAFIDKIRMSNLCTEINLPTSPLNHIDCEDGEIALCVLSAINVGAVKSLDELEAVCDNVVRSLDFVIDEQEYPVKAAEKMLKRRSIGIGITNFAYYLAKKGVSYESPEAVELMDELMEHIQFYCLKASMNLAKEVGPCEWFDKTKYSLGILPIDTYCKEVDNIVKRKPSLDWEWLRAQILEHGLRNSTLTAQMPCESSSVAINSTNGIEAIRSLITTKKSKQGLLRMVAPEIHKLKNKYTIAFDVRDNQAYTNVQAAMQKWIDQGISGNHYYNFKHYEGGNLPMSKIMKDIMYAYKMGIKQIYYANTYDGKTDDIEEMQSMSNCDGGACSI
jgi:ribonucleoside-diphosphate reductase alpha chain